MIMETRNILGNFGKTTITFFQISFRNNKHWHVLEYLPTTASVHRLCLDHLQHSECRTPTELLFTYYNCPVHLGISFNVYSESI